MALDATSITPTGPHGDRPLRRSSRMSTRLAIVAVVPVVLTASLITLLVRRAVPKAVIPSSLVTLKTYTQLLATDINADLESARADVRTWRNDPDVREVALRLGEHRPPTSKSLNHVAAHFTAELQAKPSYLQLRIIAADGGHEVVRVDRQAAGLPARRVPRVGLQNKSRRPYVIEGLRLRIGEIYTSRIELNQEHGKVEIPPVPVVRIIAPLPGPNRHIAALIVLNIDLRPLFRRLRTAEAGSHRVYLALARGDYALNPDSSREFAMDLGRTDNWRADFPEVAKESADTVITWMRKSGATGLAVSAVRLPLDSSGPLTLIVTRPDSALTATASTVLHSALLSGLVVSALAVLFAIILTGSMTKPLRRLTEAVDTFRVSGAWTVPSRMAGELGILSETFSRMAVEVSEKTHQLEQEIAHSERIQEQLVRSQKMQAVGRLASGIAHDFNNVLTTILGNAEAFRSATDEEGDRSHWVDEITHAATRASMLTRQLLAIGGRQAVEPQPLDLNEVVTGAERLLRPTLGADIALTTDLADDLGAILADHAQMEQVILNLVVNARDAMPTGGRLSIETANVTLDTAYADEHLRTKPGSYVMLAVTDTGTGMDEDTQTHLFDPFFTTKAPGKGTGLGLAMVQGIVEQSGGSLWVYSELGVGTRFKIYLPRVQQQPSAQATQTAPEPPVAIAGNETVLLVEDDDSVRSVTERSLMRFGYHVLSASRGYEALKVAAEHAAEIDVIVTDVVLPDIDGPLLVKQLQTFCAGVPVLLTSGYGAETVSQRGALPPDSHFLQKPFTVADLARKIREMV